jgi:hypothetical protein
MNGKSTSYIRDYLSQLRIDGWRISERFEEYRFLSERLKNRFYYRSNLSEDIYNKLLSYYQTIIITCDFISWKKTEPDISPQDYLLRLHEYYDDLCKKSKAFWATVSEIDLDTPKTYYISILSKVVNDLDSVLTWLEGFVKNQQDLGESFSV